MHADNEHTLLTLSLEALYIAVMVSPLWAHDSPLCHCTRFYMKVHGGIKEGHYSYQVRFDQLEEKRRNRVTVQPCACALTQHVGVTTSNINLSTQR